MQEPCPSPGLSQPFVYGADASPLFPVHHTLKLAPLPCIVGSAPPRGGRLLAYPHSTAGWRRQASTAVFLVLFIHSVSWHRSCVVRLHRRDLDLTLALKTDCHVMGTRVE